ncbi:MAG: SulP family inorganic anion transporter [Gammaproteobacteria bacterium]|nr:SulP family inorganic anion transporter [Gammaproteobacteria bacterium]
MSGADGDLRGARFVTRTRGGARCRRRDHGGRGLAHACPAFSEAYLGIATIVALQAGILLWLLRVTQMGGIVNLLSHPVITGFVNAAALLIILSQLSAFIGVDAAHGTPFQQAIDLANRLPDLNVVAALIGIVSFAILWVTRRYAFYLVLPFLRRVGRQHPITRTGPIWVSLGAIAAVTYFALDTRFGVDTVGFVPPGLPKLTIPPFDLGLWLELLPNSALIALVAYVESYSIGTTLAGRKHRRINSNQELIALGAANIGAAFTAAYPVAGSFSRSTINVAAARAHP